MEINKNYLYSGSEAVLRWLYPRRCPICGNVVKDKKALACGGCIRQLPYIDDRYCFRCGKQLEDGAEEYCPDCRSRGHLFAAGRSVWIHGGPIGKAVYQFKYGGKREYGLFFAHEMARRWFPFLQANRIQAVIPVPLHKARYRERGYNQAGILAGHVGKLTGLPVYEKCLVRVKNTLPQKMLGGGERQRNLENAFQMADALPASRILLIDDIYTTGATLDWCSAVLLRAGAESVYFCTVTNGIG